MSVVRRRSLALALVVAVTTGASTLVTPLVRAGAATNTVAIGAGLHGPRGLVATVYARSLKKISAVAVDAQGRIWAATAQATDANTDAIYLVSAAGATPQKVVTDVHTPLGLLWMGDTLYVAQSSGVLALRGFDGTQFTSRTSVLTIPSGTGEVNGIAQGSDGRLYLGISAPCDDCSPTATWSASVLSFLPDGSDVQVVADHIRAAVGLAFWPGTDDLLVTMNQRDDLGAKTPGDWLALVKSGQSWGFPACYGQHTAACDEVPAPIAVLAKHAAVSGVAIVTGQLGTTVGTGAVVAEWATGHVKLVRVTRSAAGYTGRTTSFLTGFANPVPVLVDGTGALYVGDWTSGRLYRITG
jgi:glucose/arabinose dehydrogenase